MAIEAHPAEAPTLSWRHNHQASAGRKARGQLQLPASWVPPFLVVPARLMDVLRADDGIFDRTFAPLMPEIEARLLDGAEHLLVRSDGPQEGRLPGGGVSFVIPASGEALEPALRRYAAIANLGDAPIIQRAVEPALLGLMSNERHVSRSRALWLVEGPLDLRKPGLRRIRATNDAGRPALLRAHRPPELVDCLRQIATRLTALGGHWRCEWVWDGTRVWVVQADRARPGTTDDHGFAAYLRGHQSAGQGRTWAEVRFEGPEQPAGFEKLRSRQVFSELSWPVAPSTSIRGDRWRQLEDPKDWFADLLRTARAPLVIRTDTRRGSSPFLLPTSDPLSDAAALTRFGAQIAKRMHQSGIAPRDWLLIVAPLLPTHASALVQARPDDRSVDIDALWAHPDGLLALPHDSYAVNETNETVSLLSEVRFKPAALWLSPDGRRRVPVSPPSDWGRTLRQDEARQLASWGRQLAESYRQPIGLMVLCRLGGQRGPQSCVPFHFWTVDRPAQRGAVARQGPTARISGRSDLRRLAELHDAVVSLEPGEGLDRDASFFKEVGLWAAERRITIVFSGSVLGHARNTLERTGAVVAAPPDLEQPRHHEGLAAAIVLDRDGLRRVRLVPAHALPSGLDASLPPRSAFSAFKLVDSSVVPDRPTALDAIGNPGLFIEQR